MSPNKRNDCKHDKKNIFSVLKQQKLTATQNTWSKFQGQKKKTSQSSGIESTQHFVNVQMNCDNKYKIKDLCTQDNAR